MHKDEMELFETGRKLGLCIYTDYKAGSVQIFEHVGDFECISQALLFLKNNYVEGSEEIEDGT